MLFFSESIAMASEAVAQEAAKQPSLFESMVPMLLIFVVMYFLIIRPQAKKAKEHASLLKNLKAGDDVVTSGGIMGRVKAVSERSVSLDAGGVVLEVMKEHISKPSANPVSKEARVPGSRKKGSRQLRSSEQVTR